MADFNLQTEMVYLPASSHPSK